MLQVCFFWHADCFRWPSTAAVTIPIHPKRRKVMSQQSALPTDNPVVLRIQCPSCSTVYKIKETAIASYPASFKCKKCNRQIRIDAPAKRPSAASASGTEQPVKTGGTSESGPPAVSPTSIASSPVRTANSGPDPLMIFIGSNAPHYLERFKKFTAFGASDFAATWHWPAFFVPWLWFLYRKLYLWSLISFVTGLIPLVNLAARIAWGITANYLFYKHAHRKISRCKELSRRRPAMPLNQTLRKQGGVHNWVWGFSALPLIGIVAAIAIPQFSAYRTRAFDAQAKAAVQQVADAQQIYHQRNHQYADSIEQLNSVGLSLQNGPDLVVSLLGTGPENYYVESFHTSGNKRFASCAAESEVAVLPYKSQEIFGPDSVYALTVPVGWQQVKNLNEEAEIQIAQASKDCYVIVFAEKQEDLQVTDLADYSVLVRSSIQQSLLQPEVQETGLNAINHLDVVQFEIRGILQANQVPVVYLHTVVLGQHNYYQIVAWTTDMNYAANQSTIRSIVNHFKEI
jgi:predicted Zn finger-like uncharacterized protein